MAGHNTAGDSTETRINTGKTAILWQRVTFRKTKVSRIVARNWPETGKTAQNTAESNV